MADESVFILGEKWIPAVKESNSHALTNTLFGCQIGAKLKQRAL